MTTSRSSGLTSAADLGRDLLGAVHGGQLEQTLGVGLLDGRLLLHEP